MTTRAPSPAAAALAERAMTLPDLVRPAILASFTGMTESATCRQIRAGVFGAYCKIGRRYFLRRDSILATLASREVHPEPPASPPLVPAPPAWATDLLARRRGGSGRS